MPVRSRFRSWRLLRSRQAPGEVHRAEDHESEQTTLAQSDPPISTNLEASANASDILELSEGLDVLVDPTKPGQAQTEPYTSPSVDIIAVHGLGGNMYNTWRSSNGTLWLRDFLAEDLPRARVSTFGYDSSLFQSRSIAGVDEFARQLLRASAVQLQKTQCPIVFVCHSLGGIVVKKALVIAHAERKRYSEFLRRVKIVMFLGTPHDGSNIADFAHKLGKILNAGGSLFYPTRALIRIDLINLLRQNSTALGSISVDFRIPAESITILSGYETSIHPAVGAPIVPRSSALLNFPHEDLISLRGDHSQICRYSYKTDPNYRDILGALKQALEDVSPATSISSGHRIEQSSIKSLTVSEIEYVSSVGGVHPGYKQVIGIKPKETCAWLFQDDRFSAWYNQAQPCILWITGFPGTGKTTMSAFVANFLAERRMIRVQSVYQPRPPQATTAVYCTFCESLDAKNRNAGSILKDLLVQMIIRDKQVLYVVRKIFNTARQRFEHSFDSIWKVFKVAARSVQSHSIFVLLDGLDGCEETSLRQLLTAITDLVRAADDNESLGPRIKFLLSSRPGTLDLAYGIIGWPEAHMRLPLEEKPKGLVEDIARFIDRAVDDMIGRRILQKQTGMILMNSLKQRADGSFLWVSVVLQEIERNVAMSKARGEAIINELPHDLTTAYTQYLPMVPTEFEPLLRKLLSFLVASMRPMKLHELGILLVVEEGMNMQQLRDQELDSVERTLTTMLGSLVQVSDSSVSFIHLSVRDFFLKLGESPSHSLHSTHGIVLEAAHLALANACVNYLLMETFDREFQTFATAQSSPSEQSPVSPEMDSQEFSGSLAFALDEVEFFQEESDTERLAQQNITQIYSAYDYAAMHWYYHLATPKLNGDVHNLVQKLIMEDQAQNFLVWFKYYSNTSRATIPNVDELRIVPIVSAVFGWTNILQGFLHSQKLADNKIIVTAMLWAALRAHEDCFRLLLAQFDASKPTNIQPCLLAAAQGGSAGIMRLLLKQEHAPVLVNETDGSSWTALHFACDLNHHSIVSELLKCSDLDVNSTNRFGKTPLHQAALGGSVQALRLLCHDGRVNLNKSDRTGRTALSYAAEEGFTDMVRILLKYSYAHNQTPDIRHRTALSYAASATKPDVVAQLLRHGFKARDKDKGGRTALSWAINSRGTTQTTADRATILRLLIESDESILDEPDENGWTPLFWAVDMPGFPDVIETLASYEQVDINRKDKYSQRTVLSWAAAQGLEQIVRILLNLPSIDIFTVDATGMTPLSHAAANGMSRIARLLLTRNVQSASTEDNSGRRPMDWALLNGHKSLAAELEDAIASS